MSESHGMHDENNSAACEIKKQMIEEDKVMKKEEKTTAETKDTVLVNVPDTVDYKCSNISREDFLTLQKNMNNQFSKLEEKLKEALDSFGTSCKKIELEI